MSSLSTAGWARHQSEAASAGMLTVATGLPRLLAKGFALAWQASRGGAVGVLLGGLLGGVFTAASLLATTRVLGHLIVPHLSAAQIRQAVPSLVWVAVAAALAGGFSNLSSWLLSRLGPKVDRLVELRFVSLSTKVGLAAFDEPDFHDALHRARERGVHDASRVVVAVFNIATSLIGTLSAAYAIAVMHPLLLVVLAAACVPEGWAALRAAKMRYAVMFSLSENRRRKWLLLDLMAGRSAAAELRAFAMRDFLLGQYDDVASHVRDRQLRVANSQTLVQVSGDMAGAIGMCLLYAALIGLLAAGYVPLAVAGSAVFAVRTGQGSLKAILLSMNSCYESGLYLGDFYSFCAEAEKRLVDDRPNTAAPEFETIFVDDVSFGYHGSTDLALSGVSMELKKGETIALVGENGSGKTTLAKLLAGLYQPSAGAISWDGVPTGSLDPATLTSRIAVVSQDLIGWPFSARDNVAMGSPVDPERLDLACAAAGADEVVTQLPEGYATVLDRRFVGGQELSGGQWQRVALARGFYRDAPLLICDEPTSALDARAEDRVFQTIRSLASRRTTVLITHRLANVIHVDRIYVLDRGRVIESGTHEFLISHGTRYRELFMLQAAAYCSSDSGPSPSA